MARQRFIWPSIWKDPIFGRLTDAEQVLFIGLFSIADDEGRLLADPAYIRSELFPYREVSVRKVTALVAAVAEKCDNVHLYEHEGTPYIALLKWTEYQKPKYPKPSRIIPPTFPEGSPNASTQGWVGMDRDGLGRDGEGRTGLDREGSDRAERPESSFKIPDLKGVA